MQHPGYGREDMCDPYRNYWQRKKHLQEEQSQTNASNTLYMSQVNTMYYSHQHIIHCTTLQAISIPTSAPGPQDGNTPEN
jgi:hypothetical protein